MQNAISPSNAFVNNFKRAFSFKHAYNTGFLSDTLLKLNFNSSQPFVLEGLGTSDLKFRSVSAFSNSDYLFFSNMFNIFFSCSPIKRSYPFSFDRLRSVTSGSGLASRLQFSVVSFKPFFNFFYFILFYYLPRVVSIGSTISNFSTSVLFPDFSVYGHYFSRLAGIYPHYAIVMKRVGFFLFLEEYKVCFNFNVSSYVLRSTYLSYTQSSDWNLKFKVYYGLRTKKSSLIDFFRLQRSYFKFFVVGKKQF